MFKRVFVEEWALCIPIVAFFIFFTVFLVITVRALRLGRKERDRLASLPLEDSSSPDSFPQP